MGKNRLFKRLPFLRPMAMLVTILLLSGCWSAKEINNLAIINVIGIDENDTGEVEVTAVMAKPYSLFSETAVSGNEENKFLIVITTGKSIFEALSNLSATVPEKLYFGHLDAVILGERAARERTESALDFFKRETDFRPNIQLLVTKGSAAELVKTVPQQNLTLGLEINDLVLSNRLATTGMVKDMSQFTEALMSNTTAPYTGVISVAEKKQEIDIHGNKQDTINQQTKNKEGDTSANSSGNDQGNVPKALNLNETAVFKKGQLRGFLDEEETRGFLWIKGEVQSGIVVLNCGKKGEGDVSLNVTNSVSKLIPQVSGKSPKMNVQIEVEADIGQLTCKDINLTSKFLNRLNEKFEEKVRREAIMALNKAKNQWQTDIFGFGRAINQKSPKKWNQMASQWKNGLLRETEIDLRVSAIISRYGLFKEPPGTNK
ncbi:Ger(x)C family spore germination protein [Virgibacillus doumboii]|uniref:Ger(x)C family spore germination protein n=1 Tax=Virgibacillus doumboii TaxID=2697503 RepID=UPI0013DF2489|nr:Ger(x)C family spore germination protein [Virgibacillus doumboii]